MYEIVAFNLDFPNNFGYNFNGVNMGGEISHNYNQVIFGCHLSLVTGVCAFAKSVIGPWVLSGIVRDL
ncbi:hypothetical protein ME9_01293 [Bartonella taylorii 8TBB]|uniref:Uncharacterized protein n=1 Tax=Bartonella taylorii 8TBB TaxID=1094560 RepID=A0A9P2RZA2_BARTA|nr:hypothetical protein ME9_01293 [Bartonella taylorii 8TBB]